MPTGYTAGIIDGEIKTFQEFAKICVRAFGACIHLKEESLSKEYTPRTPSDYHLTALESAQERLGRAQELTNVEIIENRKKEIKEQQIVLIEEITKTKETAKKLERFLEQANNYEPPTPEHKEIREFMIDQLQQTLNWDGQTEYYENKLVNLELELQNIDAGKIRTARIDSAYYDIDYHSREYTKEVARCKESNEWVEIFLESLEDIPEGSPLLKRNII